MAKSSIVRAFSNAICGLILCIRLERNMRIHISAAVAAIFLAWYFQISKYEVAVLSLAIMVVLIAEMINTAIEAVVNLVSPEYHRLAKMAKDIAAGAVLLAAIAASIIGYILFFDKLVCVGGF